MSSLHLPTPSSRGVGQISGLGGEQGDGGGPGSLQVPGRRQAAFQDLGDVLLSRRSGKRRFQWERVQDPALSLGQQDMGNGSPREGRWEEGLWGALAGR